MSQTAADGVPLKASLRASGRSFGQRWWWAALFLLGVAGFSQLSYRLTVEMLRLPLYTPEPFFLILLALLYWNSSINNRPRFTAIFFSFASAGVCVFLFLCLLAFSSSSLREVVSTGRPFVLVGLAAVFGSCLRSVKVEEALAFLMGVLAGELVNALLAPKLDPAFRGITAVNLIAVFAAVSLSILRANIRWIGGILAIVVLLIFLSGFRAVMAVSAIAFFSALLLSVRHAGLLSGFGRIISWTVVGVIASSVGVWTAIQKIGVDPFAYHRIVNRTVAYFTGDLTVAQDQDRFEKLARYWQDPGEIWPCGFVMVGQGLTGDFNDVPFLYFTYTLGVAVGLIVLGVLLVAGARHSTRVLFRRVSWADEMGAVGFFVFCFLILFNGRFLYIAYESVLFGLLLGLWFSPVARDTGRSAWTYFLQSPRGSTV